MSPKRPLTQLGANSVLGIYPNANVLAFLTVSFTLISALVYFLKMIPNIFILLLFILLYCYTHISAIVYFLQIIRNTFILTDPFSRPEYLDQQDLDAADRVERLHDLGEVEHLQQLLRHPASCPP